MMKYKSVLFLFLVFATCAVSFAQDKIERQHRIKKSQFPAEAIQTLTENSSDIKRLKFYQEIDTTQKIYTAKFKKSRLFYEMDFDKNGAFSSAAFAIKQVDIPEDSFQKMANYLSQTFEKVKTRKMFQLYHTNSEESVETIIKNSFQNLMVPNMYYEFIVRGFKNSKKADYEVLFDADGKLVRLKESLPANYDRVLY
ncbi:hypothetical protein JQC67_01555 [Aurantibacter crassamenti]|uniref:hypothetical protein n=1 Tax=Aurantibacter crassamenti TaxID=1837375 RepID=UPI00193A16FD|nr:hypothetical protein [Aurantibacter crassamenti]MBM1104812.1 hypothetical protein [Aurantibacter crassamenti]